MKLKDTLCEEYDLYRMSDARTLVLGIATIWVAFFHSYNLDFSRSALLAQIHLDEPLQLLKSIGNAGVDLFLFFSGFGLYFSLEKNGNLKRFYSKRFLRIIPEVLIVSFIYYGYIGAENFYDWLGKVFLYGHYVKGSNGGRYWYFALIIVLYLVYPGLHQVMKRWELFGMLSLLAIMIGSVFILREYDIEYFNQIEIILLRVPIFIIGIWFGQKAYEHAKVPKWIVWLMVPLSIIFIEFSYRYNIPARYTYLWRYKYVPMVITMTIAISYLNSIFSDNFVKRFLVLMGGYSLEFYLLYENLYLYMKNIFKPSENVGVTYAIAVFTMSFILSVALQKINNLLVEKVFTRSTSDQKIPKDSLCK